MLTVHGAIVHEDARSQSQFATYMKIYVLMMSSWWKPSRLRFYFSLRVASLKTWIFLDVLQNSVNYVRCCLSSQMILGDTERFSGGAVDIERLELR